MRAIFLGAIRNQLTIERETFGNLKRDVGGKGSRAKEMDPKGEERRGEGEGKGNFYHDPLRQRIKLDVN